MPTANQTEPSPLIRKLQEMRQRLHALRESLNDPATQANPQKLVAASKEAGQLEPLVAKYDDYEKTRESAAELARMAQGESDAEMAALVAAELADANRRAAALLESLQDELLAAEDYAVQSFFLEIRAGTGGEEAALFGRDLYEMYRRYCDSRGLRFDVSDFSTSDRGGFKEVIVNIRGKGAYRRLRFEGGGHRVQRVPQTEAQGRIHTSAATVAVLPEMPDVKIEINSKDVEEFGCRGGGPGGQNVNKVETGWRILHKPSGLQFKMTEHKSQAQNKERAWALLRATLYEAEQARQHAAQSSARKTMIGSGDRSQRIRTYNFPQNRCTDHRLGGPAVSRPAASTGGGGEKNFKLDQIMAGQLDPLLDALLELDKRQRLENL
jgi:peptide chain release factor 1